LKLIAAAILLILSDNDSITLVSAGGVALLVLALIALFTFKYVVIEGKGKKLMDFLRGSTTYK